MIAPARPHITTRVTALFWALIVTLIGLAYVLQPTGREASHSFAQMKQWGAHLDRELPLLPWGCALLFAAALILTGVLLDHPATAASGCFLAATVVWVGLVGVTAAAVADDATWSGPPFYAALLASLLACGRDLVRRG